MKNLLKICLLAICIIGCSNAFAQTQLTFYTTKGNVNVLLTDALTPRTVDSFLARVRKKFYDGLTFHRVVVNFVVQGGDPLGDGTGTPGYYTPAQIDTPTLKNNQGTIAMASQGPGTNTDGCQFYFNLVNNSNLDGKYTVFGTVTSGFSYVQTIGHVAVDANNKPITPVYMDSVRITYKTAVPLVINNINLSVYPNPGKGLFTITLPELDSKLQVLNTNGQVVYATTANGKLTLDLRNQPTGVYTIRIINQQGTANTKLILQ